MAHNTQNESGQAEFALVIVLLIIVLAVLFAGGQLGNVLADFFKFVTPA